MRTRPEERRGKASTGDAQAVGEEEEDPAAEISAASDRRESGCCAGEIASMPSGLDRIDAAAGTGAATTRMPP